MVLRLSFSYGALPPSILMQTTLSPSAPKLANENHPYFVGLAHLRSLLVHEDIAHDEDKTNAVLDLIGLLLRQAPAQASVKAFCRMRQVCGSVCYLALYRLRRWLEAQIMVQVGGRDWQPLELKFDSFRRNRQDLCRADWESNLETTSPQDVSVTFCWRGLSDMELEALTVPLLAS